MAPDDEDTPLSEAAEDVEERARRLVSDLTPFDVGEHKPRRLSDRTKRLYLAALIFVIVFVLWLAGFVVVNPFGSSDPDTATPAASADVASTQSNPATSAVNSDAVGPLSGTWTMYWTPKKMTERPAFTVRFTGTDRGTVEILNEDTESNAHFRLDGDLVWFTFTRVFDIETDDSGIVKWPEISVFEGAFTGVDGISGEWAREAWDCVPDRDPPCVIKPDAIGDKSRLVREP